jgi:hypothetical protein
MKRVEYLATEAFAYTIHKLLTITHNKREKEHSTFIINNLLVRGHPGEPELLVQRDTLRRVPRAFEVARGW